MGSEIRAFLCVLCFAAFRKLYNCLLYVFCHRVQFHGQPNSTTQWVGARDAELLPAAHHQRHYQGPQGRSQYLVARVGAEQYGLAAMEQVNHESINWGVGLGGGRGCSVNVVEM